MERESKTEKAKKAKKATEMEDDEIEDYTDEEAMESYGEESHFEAPTIPSCVPSVTHEDSSEESESEVTSTVDREDSYRQKREQAMKTRWMSVTGRKPLSIPTVMVYKPQSEKDESIGPAVFFGDRRPLMVEKKRKENWMKLKMNTVEKSYLNEGRVTREVRLRHALGGLRCLRFSPLGDSMVASFGNGSVQILKPNTGEVSLTLNTIETLYKLEVLALRFHPKNIRNVYVGGAVGLVQVFDVEETKCLASIREKNNEICNLDISPNGSLLISVGKDGHIHIYDAHTLKLLSLQRRPSLDEYTTPEKELSYHHMRLYGLRCHPTDPNLFVTGGWDYTVKVWDVRVCGAVNSIHGPRICGDSIDLRDNEILTGSWTSVNSLKLWDLSSGRLLRNISVMNRSSPVDGDFIYVAKFFNMADGRNSVVVGGNGNNEVRVINIDNSMVTASFPSLKAVTALDTYENVVAYGGMESLLRIGDVKTSPKVPNSSRE